MPPVGYFDPYFANMQQGIGTQIEGLATQMQQQLNVGLENVNANMQGQFQAFGHHIHNTVYQPIMNSMQTMQQNLHGDMAALDSRFDYLPTSEQYQQLADSQAQLQQNFNTLNTSFTDFSTHFYSVYPAPVPPPQFYPHQLFYPPPPPPPPADD